MHRMVRKAALPAALVLGVGAAATAMDSMQAPVATLGAQAAAPVDPIPAGAASLSSAFRAASKAAPMPALRLGHKTKKIRLLIKRLGTLCGGCGRRRLCLL